MNPKDVTFFNKKEYRTCNSIKAIESPVGARQLNVVGNIVAKMTISAVMQGRSPP